ncbi:hypothetical protein LUZ60_009278 [Juncus effusus]|nr:hypothetical protein LUZ60_009278 [Juncus effusus]
MAPEKGESSTRTAETEMNSTGAHGADLSAQIKGKGVYPDLEAGITKHDPTDKEATKKCVTSSCLHRKPSNVTASLLNNKAYHNEIGVVAIGPNRDRLCEKLHFTDTYKSRILAWMKQVFALDETKYLTEINNRIRNNPRKYHYSDIVDSPEELSKMLLLDSCFILFTLKRFGCASPSEMHDAIKVLQVQGNLEQLRVETDLLGAEISKHRKEIMLDFIIFGNQMPLIAVKKLIETYPTLQTFVGESSIRDLALSFFRYLKPKQNTELNMEKSHDFNNLLHLFHWSRIPATGKYRISKIGNRQPPAIPSATELKESGITFKKMSSGSSLDITFEEGLFKITGTFKIPIVDVNEYNEIIFRSLLDFERENDFGRENNERGGCYFTAYSATLAHLLRSEDDVKLFKKNKILPNAPTIDTEVVNFFQDLIIETEVTKDIPQLYEMYKIVRDHHGSWLSQNYGQFKLRYCSNFWVTLGVLLFGVATVLQTVFTVLSYLKPRGH